MKVDPRIAIAVGIVLSVLSHPAAAQGVRSAVAGSISDADSGEPVPHVQILLEEAARSGATDADGSFLIPHVPAGVYTLKTYRIGYESLIRTVRVTSGDTVRVDLSLRSSALTAGEVLVESEEADERQLLDAAMQLEGRRLRQQLGTTIAETLSEEPGITMRSMGPAPARPVLRGLGGERLLVLEDGGRTGDLSATSSDHALVLDPMTAERIEVIRGPAALSYGSNALGGVVNVIRGYVPTTLPRRLAVGFATQAQTVNSGLAAGLTTTLPASDHLAVRADAAFRRANDVTTPAGSLQNTDLGTVNGSVGASYIDGWGHVGVAVGRYASDYGIPGGFVGAHPNGVDVRMERDHAEVRSEFSGVTTWMPRVEARGAYSRYHHQEFEANGNLGIEYGLLNYTAHLTAHVNRPGVLQRGAFGLWAEYRDYAAGGYAFTPPSTETTLAGFVHQDLHLRAVTAQAGIRYDYRIVNPEGAEDRTFGGLSAAATVLWHPAPALTFGASVMRSLRMPGIEELYSEGPHLAAYSFEVGNPALEAERGWGIELFVRRQTRSLHVSLAAYRNLILNYIFPLNTGEINHRVFLPIYRHEGAKAVMTGGEGSASVRLGRGVWVDGSFTYVRGSLPELDHPIPWTPPLQGTLGLSYRRGGGAVGASARLAATQDRVGPFETRTPGYAVVNFFAQYHFTAMKMLHTLDLTVQNVSNTEYRDHLSRVKSVMPEPGRNVRLLYRTYL